MKKILTLRIEVDLNHKASKLWKKKDDFFESEVNEVFNMLDWSSDKYKSENGQTYLGSKFELIVKKEK